MEEDYFDFTAEMSEEVFQKKEIKVNKLIRVELDFTLQNLKRCPSSRERSLGITKIQEAIMWLGMDLGRINKLGVIKSPNPYPDSYDPSNDKIAPIADGLKL